MAQEIQETTRRVSPIPGTLATSESLAALLALAGSRRLKVDELRSRTKLNFYGFGALLYWLQREYLVDVVSKLEGDRIQETVELTDKGECVLIGLLEQTCELPELR